MSELARTLNCNEDSVKERLLRAALELFASRGYSAISVREIVAAARVSKPVLYYYFTNKEGIYIELLESALCKFKEILERDIKTEGTYWEKLVHQCETVYHLFQENMDFLNLMNAMLFSPPKSAPAFDWKQFYVAHKAAIFSIVQQGITAGEFIESDANELSQVILAIVAGSMHIEFYDIEKERGIEQLRKMLQIVYRGIRNHETEK